MPKYSPLVLLTLGALLGLLVTACSASRMANDPALVIKGYFQALQARDLHQMINLSCAAWEAQATEEYRSFDAVQITLEDVECQEAGKENDILLVTCKGKIVANYGAENLIIELGERKYQVVKEGGEWRMCGYR